LFGLGYFGMYFSAVVYNIAQISYRQAICPPTLLGRMNASVRWIAWGTIPLGALAGGSLATWIGVRATLWIAGAGVWAAGLLVFFSPLRGRRDVEIQ
jgi:predicted MFS family arabinose efflux permease